MKHAIKYLEPYRKGLRSRMTPAEAFLWTYLKSKQLQGRRFRRQHSIGNFIVDFYCPSEKLVIELDGEYHNNQIEKDEVRDEMLKGEGIKVIRIENRHVFDDTVGVLRDIEESFGWQEKKLLKIITNSGVLPLRPSATDTSPDGEEQSVN